jgi:hypothetical protein
VDDVVADTTTAASCRSIVTGIGEDAKGEGIVGTGFPPLSDLHYLLYNKVYLFVYLD